MYGPINWSLVQAQQQSFMGLSQFFPPKRCGKTRPKTGFHFNVQKRPVPESHGASLAKRPHLESRLEADTGGKKSACGSVSASCTDAKKKSLGVSTPDVSQSTAFLSSLSLVLPVGMLSHF